jgi:peptidoglycan/LPS O-acetylase OafA/YrhL
MGDGGAIAQAAPSRLESLTGLRFIAAFAVFGLHLTGVNATPIYSPLHHVFGAGATGVSFFFILSGFVLTWSHESGDTAARFMRRRVARIYPLHVFTWVAAGAILTYVSGIPPVLPGLANLLLLGPFINSPHYYGAMNQPSWSLGCEMFFYVLFPFVLPAVINLSRRARLTFIPAFVVFCFLWAAVAFPATNGTTSYWLLYPFPLTRLGEFVIGIILAIEVKEERLPRIPLSLAGLIAAAAFVGASFVPKAFGFVSVTLLPFMLLIVAAAQADVSSRPTILSRRWMVRLGVWSYAIYLLHDEVIYVLDRAWHTSSAVSAAAFGLVAFSLTLGLSGAAHRFIERPAERALRLPRRQRLQPALALAAQPDPDPPFSLTP